MSKSAMEASQFMAEVFQDGVALKLGLGIFSAFYRSMESDFFYQIYGVEGNADTILSKFGGLTGRSPGARRSSVRRWLHMRRRVLLVSSRIIPHHASIVGGFNVLTTTEQFFLLFYTEFQSWFDVTFTSTLYAAKLNHADTTFRDSDGFIQQCL
ncbi:hypothetical protein GN244_ATG17035 [Phytophthora infestans]|uniref:Uncharacterized protein n=1 Tax=Phytophthora infestans TaxID=4787 RepID=A0A833W6Y3_PHYIN|nr:hypothetical protein GN244_ATG17035 [Phytophthora infestans]